ncbi:hypothetical protein MK786_01135 [Microbacterium sp. CFH 31415]|uniref:AbiJ-NTD4 domain-containing protein n=1 Tax=Microbacterium sp. CFH 31415 TaxID=2921732 RepID=UPI001F12CEF3|nr:hypothetical protein [Microbacterium sp. CFH 31415]MCH6229343.1 hypothetical protein [Microbacterium sp. CFH 31415]
MKFSERYGYTEARTVAQVESMDSPLRTALWNVTYQRFLKDFDTYEYRNGASMMRVLWASLFHWDIATVPEFASGAAKTLRMMFENEEWYVVYDIVQTIVTTVNEPELTTVYNEVLETHLAGYRIIDGDVTPLSDAREVESVEDAIANSGPYAAVRHHLRTALTLYSRLENPDYANSVKESISSVEAIARILTGKNALGPALDELRSRNPDLHPALVAGWKSLYGFTSDAPAIRHGGAHAPDVSQDLARYFLVTCSAIVNFLIGTAR